MNRRTFIGKAAYPAMGLAAFQLLNQCTQPAAQGKDETSEVTKFPLEEQTIDGLQNLMKSGEMSAVEITKAYLKRIEEVDNAGVKLNAVIEVNPDAVSIAEALDQERKSGRVRGPLHGIPVLIKDNIDTGDKMMTTAGSLALEGNRATTDAFIVAELRKAGAVLLGKTNLSEWANFRSTRSSSGWSSRGGQTKNPYALDRSPCGSSSGSGSAVAANLCALAIGTETNGSICCPASTNGIVGFKPTVGLWSRSGIIPISASQDTAGPMARTVRDAAIMLGLLSAIDSTDPASSYRERNSMTDYTSFLDSNGLQGKTIGVEKSFMKGHEAIDALLKKALDVMSSKGATIVEVELMEAMKDPDGDEYNLLMYEFKDGLNRYLRNSGAKVKSLKKVIEFNEQNAKVAMPFFKQEILVRSEEKEDLNSAEYKKIYERLIVKSRKTIDQMFSSMKLDAICGPTNGPAWCIDLVNGDFFTGYGMYSPAAIAGYPSISVPMGEVLGLPVGLTFFARAFQEGPLLSVAYGYEQASDLRRPPRLEK